MQALAGRFALLLQLLLDQLSLPTVYQCGGLLSLIHLLLRDALLLCTWLTLVDLLLACSHLPVALSVLLFVLAVSLLLFDALLALFAGIGHRVILLMVRLVDALAILWRLGRQAKLLVQLSSQLLQLR